MYDAVISGAGPVGLHLARKLEERGLDYAVLEDHGRVGSPNHCSGLISTNIASLIDIDRSFIEHEVRGAVLHGERRSAKFTKPRTAAYVIDREKLDTHMSRGINVKLNSGVRDFAFRKDHVLVETDSETLESRMLIACDGANSLVRKKLGLIPKEMITGIIAYTDLPDKGDHVDLWFDKQATDGFMWKIPRGSRTEYGMLGSRVRFSQLEDFFDIRGYEKSGGMIAIGPVKSYHERILLVGDAAAQSKPWSGGGVVYGLKCAEIAASVAAEAARRHDFSEAFLKRYEAGWKNAMGRQIALGMLWRRLFRGMSNSQIDLALAAAGKVPLLNRLDMDLI